VWPEVLMSDLSVQTRWLDATGQAELVRSGLELLEAAIERIETLDPVVNAVMMRWFDHARRTVAGPVPDGFSAACRSCSKTGWRPMPGSRAPAATGGLRRRRCPRAPIPRLYTGSVRQDL
jgi:hypothetical protein